MKLTIALVGNPNSGKTTIFNNLTGARQHVANYPGVTVEKKEGRCRHGDVEITVVDLPGTYSLTAFSIEERVTRNTLMEQPPDVVVDIVDASNLERNLYLTTQLLELNVPLVLAFNMSDMVAARGEKIDTARLSTLLGAPIVPTIGSKNEGMEALLDAVVAVASGREARRPATVRYGKEIDKEIDRLSGLVEAHAATVPARPRWVALKLLENDADVIERFGATEILAESETARHRLERLFGEPADMVISERRYGFISGACQECVTNTVEFRHTVSDRIDKVITSPFLGIPIFLALMYLVFDLTFTIGEPAVQAIEFLVEQLRVGATAVLPDGTIQSIFVDGILAGVGGVLVFLPNVLLLFLAIAILEDSGYMARAAFVMDGLMHRIGLHGKSFIPMLLGFGCSVPGIMATRILEDRRDRIATMLVIPLMSCSARLPVYTVLAGAFFTPSGAGKAIFSVYILGIVLAVVLAKVFRRFLVAGPAAPFVMELPPYRVPTLKGVLIHMWERGWLFLRKIGTVILAASVVIWFLSTYPTPKNVPENLPQEEYDSLRLEGSYAAQLGKAIAPTLEPLGLGDWKVATALLVGVAGKEIVVSTLGTFYSLGDVEGQGEAGSDALRSALRRERIFNPLVVYGLMVFVLIYIPCLPTVVAVGREANSWQWAGFHVLYTTVLAWVATFVLYQGGKLLGLAGG